MVSIQMHNMIQLEFYTKGSVISFQWPEKNLCDRYQNSHFFTESHKLAKLFTALICDDKYDPTTNAIHEIIMCIK